MTRSRSGSSFRFISSFFFLLILATSAWAQKDTGSIVGTVKDPSGAIVANAKVLITDLEHGQTSSTTTSAEGEFVVSPLRVGRYTVTVEQTGFKKAISDPISLDVQQRVAINIVLQVGQITESVVVSSATPLLETETSELGQVVDSQRVANLPLNGGFGRTVFHEGEQQIPGKRGTLTTIEPQVSAHSPGRWASTPARK